MYTSTSEREIDRRLALLNAWESCVASDSTVLAAAVEHRIQKLGYKRIKPERLSAVQAALKGEQCS